MSRLVSVQKRIEVSRNTTPHYVFPQVDTADGLLFPQQSKHWTVFSTVGCHIPPIQYVVNLQNSVIALMN